MLSLSWSTNVLIWSGRSIFGYFACCSVVLYSSVLLSFQSSKGKPPPAVRELLQQGKDIHKHWIDLGKPRFNHPIVDERRAIKRLIRSQQRQDITIAGHIIDNFSNQVYML
jgi:hypothetical protein